MDYGELGDVAAIALATQLIAALRTHRHVLCVTHVPPFREACVDGIGRVNEERLPFYTCHAMGQMLRAVMSEYPDRHVTVLCGHTHEAVDKQVLPNLRVIVKSAAYGRLFTPDVISVDRLVGGT